MTRPKLLDLFCGAGGASMGYHRAGFDVVGVDIEPQPDYPFPMIVGDAMTVLACPDVLDAFNVVTASPPCPRYSTATPEANRDNHPDLVAPVRMAVVSWGGPYVIENVPGAPLIAPALLCGGAFGLEAHCRDGKVRPLQRHRIFESNAPIMSPGCGCDFRQKVGVYGDGGGGPRTTAAQGGGYKAHPEEAREALGIDWMTSRKDLSDSIPPAYTEFIGRQLIEHLERAA